MNITVANFTKINSCAIRSATMVLNKIILDNNKRVCSPGIIVDVGCGFGNVTKTMLAESVPHKKLLALDIDSAMIKYAHQNFNSSSIDYLVQDFGQNFNSLDFQLQSLENQVDLIFSNYVLHWIPRSGKLNSVMNIAKLLRPGGRFYGSITIVNDAEEFITDEEKSQLTKGVLAVPTRSEQMTMWESYFNSQNMQVEYEMVDCKNDFGAHTLYRRDWAPFITMWDQFIVNKKKYEENIDEITELFLKSYGDYRNILTAEELKSTQTVHIDTMLIKCIKM